MFNNDWKLNLTSNTFDVLDLDLFKNRRFLTVLSYLFIAWGLLILKLILFASDIYTCIKLLAFNSWSNNVIQPYLSFKISKWLFSGCIFASIVLLLWEIVNGIRVYKTRNIALTYVNYFARTSYSISNYRIFCLYNRITPKGFHQRICFYTFFEFKDCIRLLLTDTPRQVINGLTLWSVLVTVNNGADLGELEDLSGLLSKIQYIANTNHEEAVLLSFMLLSFIIWAFFMAKLVIAALFSPFVYHTIFKEYKMSGLREFVCTTVNERVEQIVEKYKWKKDQQDAVEQGLVNAYTTNSFDDLEKNSIGKILPPVSIRNLTQNTSSSLNLNGTSESLIKEAEEIPLTSIINEDSTQVSNNYSTRLLFLNNANTFDSVAQSLQDTLASKNLQFSQSRPNLSMNTYLNSESSLEEKSDLAFNAKRTFVKKMTLESLDEALNENSEGMVGKEVFPTTPVISTHLTELQAHVTTPDKVYFHEAGNSIQPRSTSLLDRRKRIKDEDYEVYAKRFES